MTGAAADLTIRLATESDRAAVTALFQDLDRFYAKDRQVAPAAVTAALVERHVFGEHGTEIAVAEIDGVAVGLASFASVFPGPQLGGNLLLKDLFVRDEVRGRGTGEAIIRFLVRLAQDRGCARLDWTTETWNEGAQRLYDRIGAARQPQKIYYRLEGAAFERLAQAGE